MSEEERMTWKDGFLLAGALVAVAVIAVFGFVSRNDIRRRRGLEPMDPVFVAVGVVVLVTAGLTYAFVATWLKRRRGPNS